jgi:hypothetical protein
MPSGAKPGERRGGKAKGTKNRATAEAKIALEDLAKTHAPEALQALVKVATSGKSEAAIVAAAIALLDRGYGKPRQAVDIAGDQTRPLVIKIVDFVSNRNRTTQPMDAP